MRARAEDEAPCCNPECVQAARWEITTETPLDPPAVGQTLSCDTCIGWHLETMPAFWFRIGPYPDVLLPRTQVPA